MAAIIVLDDEKKVRDCISNLLEVLGYSVKRVEKGEEVLKIAELVPSYDVAIFDINNYVGMGALETITWLKEHNIKVRVIVSSSDTEHPAMAHPDQYGFAGALKKPFTVASLQKAVETALAA